MIDYAKQIEITTACPTCSLPYTRMVYEHGLIVGCVLDMCNECVKNSSDEHGNALITGSVKKWD